MRLLFWVLLFLGFHYLVLGSLYTPDVDKEDDDDDDDDDDEDDEKKIEEAFNIEIDEENHVICTEDDEATNGRIWGPYYLYSNDVKENEIKRLYGEEICLKKFCKEPKELEVLRTYDSYLDYQRKLLMVRNKKSGGKVFYVQFVDDGTRRPFTVNHDYKFFFMKEEPAVDYNPDRDYYRGFPFKTKMTGKNAVAFTDFVRYTLVAGNNSFTDMFNNSCEQPFTPYEDVAEVYASEENHYNYYMVHMHCENSQENLYSLIVGIDKYCQWNGHNESLWFIGILDLQSPQTDDYDESKQPVPWWVPPNENLYLWRPGLTDDSVEVQHGVFVNKDSGVSTIHISRFVFLLLLFNFMNLMKKNGALKV